MSFLNKLLKSKEEKIKSYDSFWKWFQHNESAFFKVIKTNGDIERDFFRKLGPKLADLRDGYYYLAGMFDDKVAELVFTADGKVKNFVFIEELVDAAPVIANWKFTAHKPALDIQNVNINMSEYQFNKDNLTFYPIENSNYPDEIEITVLHPDLTEDNRSQITNGVYIFLDNYLGELNFATTIDYLTVEAVHGMQTELIPISKLRDYLNWRQKEFIEKYEGVRHNTENDNHGSFEARLESGNPVVAVMNTDLLSWDRKASHPWIFKIEIKYAYSNQNGMPEDETYQLMEEIENDVNLELTDFDGYLYVGRETANGLREVFYACKEFRKPSKIASQIIQKYTGRVDVSYDIYKDKYWRTFNHFTNN